MFNLYAMCYITTYVSEKEILLTVQNFKLNGIISGVLIVYCKRNRILMNTA